VNYVYRLDPNDQEVRKIKAGALRKMVQLSTDRYQRWPLRLEAMHEIFRPIPAPADTSCDIVPPYRRSFL
jgi:hypothetical protein